MVQRAVDRGLDLLAITDHDTIDAYTELAAVDTGSVRLVAGVEFSTHWNGQSIHVVGLGLDLGSLRLTEAIVRQKTARIERAAAIAAKLEKLGCGETLEGALRLAGNSQVGRPHFAQYLVDTGRVRSIAVAFKKYLGPGKAGDIKRHWPPLETIIGWIRAADGIAVLAHPGKYRMTNAKIGALADDFARHGGQAMEVLCGQQTSVMTHSLARICNNRGLLASCGSDFHTPDQPWAELGNFGTLPKDCRPVWDQL